MADKKSDWLRLATIGPHFLACTLFGYFVGDWIDGRFETGQLWTIILALLGIAAGFLNLFRELAIINRDEEQEWQKQNRSESEPNE